jgi:predicted alpha/beta superfamily hydrolase
MKHAMVVVGLLWQLCLLALPMPVRAATAVEFVIDLRAEIAAGRFDPARDSVGVRGAVAPLSWGQTAMAGPVPGAPGLYRLQLLMEAAAAAGQPVAHKFKIEQPGRPDAGWEDGRNRSWLLDAAAVDAQRPQRVQRVFGADPDAPPSQRSGHIERLPAQASAHVQSREVQVWLPPGYADDTRRRYPVLYLHDGQNVFDAQAAGSEWQADEAAQRGVLAGELQPMIIVAVASTETRAHDYTPWPPGNSPQRATVLVAPQRGGGAAAYGRYLLQELKPAIDARYRTLPGREHTALGGSSLGGLVTMWLLLEHAATFGAGLVVSPSVWWADEAIVDAVRQAPPRLPVPRVWLDMGTAEGPGALPMARRLRDALHSRGWAPRYEEAEGAAHTEAAWAQRFPAMLKFLYGRGP